MFQKPIRMDSSQIDAMIEDAAPSLSFNTTSENQIGTLGQQQSNSIESVVNSRNLTDDYLTRKKNKKREKSPQAAVQQPLATMNSPSVFIASELTLSSNPISNGTVQTTAVNSNSANFTNLSATTSTTTSIVVPSAATTIQIITKKEKQRPETWNKIEQQIFFNALRQNGKNFESITQYFNARQKRFKGDADVQQNVQRSKEQIRHFYYRTWHKIIKLITIKSAKEEQTTASPDPNSAPQTSANSTKSPPQSSTTSTTIVLDDQCSLRDIQVKCLIAFNALMNKSQRWNKKTAIKLVELINHGWTTVREKGKITRLRMPICKLSSKVTAKEEAEPNNALPHLICVQLEPKTETAYCRVHRLAQNPFLSIKLKSLQSVKYLIEFLEEKWKSRRDQFIEKFKIESETNNSSNKNQSNKANNNKQATNVASTSQTSTTSVANNVVEQTNANESTTDDENFQNIKKNLLNEMNLNANNTNNQNNNQNGHQSATATTTTCTNDIIEKLILYPNEIHQLSNLDLIEATNISSMNMLDDQLIESNYLISTNNVTNTVEIVNNQEFALEEQEREQVGNSKRLSQDDEPMLVDECVNVANNAKQANNSSKKNAQQKQPRVLFQLNAEQIRSGLTSFSSNITSSSNKETKDLTMLQLYLAFNKPQTIKLKYDWVFVNKSNSGQFTLNASSQNHNRQQRFYLDSLASVANSFLNDLQKTKNESLASTSIAASKAATALNKSPPKAVSQSQINNSTRNVVQTNPNVPKVNINSNPSGQRIAFLQPSNSPSKATILPIETVLQQINEEQTNKTKKLLSDLNSKRRTRNRKPIMVVNSSHNPPRTMLPKLNLLNGQPLFIKSSNEYLSFQINNNSPNSASLNTVDIQNPTQNDVMPMQNIVYSAPVAAIARQIVNNSSNNSIPSQNLAQQQQQQQQQPQQTKTIHFQNTFSNILPHIISSLQNDSVQIVGVDNEGENNNNNANNQQAANNIEGNEGGNLTSEHLGDMSLLDLSINNNDSLFATANNIIVCSNETSNQVPTQMNLFGSIGSSDKMNRHEEPFHHVKSNQMNGVNVDSEVPTSSSVINNAISNSNQNSICFDLNQKRAELMNEWSDSMNDISLSGCFISDLQSPEKPSSKNMIHVLNENSRDSIFFNMDTIMDIIPPQPAARFDESSLIANLNTNNLQNS